MKKTMTFEYEKPELVGYRSYLSQVLGETEDCDELATALPDDGGGSNPCGSLGGQGA